MKSKLAVFTAVIALAVFGCNNFLHDLVPPDGNRIESFSVPGQMSVEIGENTITAYVPPGTDLKNLIPSIRVSSGATLFPVTYEYVSRTFGDERTFGAAMELYRSGNMTEKVVELIRENKDSFTRPALDLPVNFGYPVDFLVVSGRGTIRQYKVTVEIDTGEGKFKSFKFDKFYNPEVVYTAVGTIDTASKTVMVNVSYPVENIASYQLTPSFETYNGARVYLGGTEWKSGETLIDFLKPPDSLDLSNPTYGSQTKTLILRRAGFNDAVWTLIVTFSEDPDTNNKITDFRFTKSLNPLINADYVAEINHTYGGNTIGRIDVTVYYSGANLEELKASFVSPGTVTVNDIMQTSGYSTQNFSGSPQYKVTSKVGNYVRTYDIYVTLVPGADPTPQITYFAFRTEQNPVLVSSSIALIDHNARLILIEAAYDGDTPPYNLIPQFSATGPVTVNNVTQTDALSSVNFSSPVGYVVSNPSNPSLKREYRVEVQFVHNLSSGAEITTYTFYKADNPGLIADTHATVNQATGAITVTLFFETPGGDRTLVPRWTSQGRIESNGVPQTSGNPRQFYTPQRYRAASADGIFQRNYTVTIKEINSRIYVKHDAAGRNDGTNWENAYQNPVNVNSDLYRFYANSPAIMKEVWIAEGTYVMRGSMALYSNTSVMGGFIGNEASASARATPAIPFPHRPVLTGDPGNGQLYTNSLLTGSSNGGVISIEELVITRARVQPSIASGEGGGVWLSSTGTAADFRFTGVEFSDLHSGRLGGAVSVWGGRVTMNDCRFVNTSSGGGGAVFLSGRYVTGIAWIRDCSFNNTHATEMSNDETERGGGALYFSVCDIVFVTNCSFYNTYSFHNEGNAIFCHNCDVSIADTVRLQAVNSFNNVPPPPVDVWPPFL